MGKGPRKETFSLSAGLQNLRTPACPCSHHLEVGVDRDIRGTVGCCNQTPKSPRPWLRRVIFRLRCLQLRGLPIALRSTPLPIRQDHNLPFPRNSHLTANWVEVGESFILKEGRSCQGDWNNDALLPWSISPLASTVKVKALLLPSSCPAARGEADRKTSFPKCLKLLFHCFYYLLSHLGAFGKKHNFLLFSDRDKKRWIIMNFTGLILTVGWDILAHFR